MTDTFIQLNKDSKMGRRFPVGYHIRTNGCWEWAGSVSDKGYGHWKTGKDRLAHRAMYRLHKGEIPAGMEIDHLCKNRRCVNPEHLEAVTSRENNARSCSPTALNAGKTHCINGHPFNDENTRRTWKSRECRACERATWHNRKHLRADKSHRRKALP